MKPMMALPVAFYTQTEAATELRVSRQLLWHKVRTGEILSVVTEGGTPLVPTAEINRLLKAEGKRGRK